MRPDFDGVDDLELLRRHAEGEAEAFSELVRRHRDRLWHVALRTLRDREEAADALQEALVSAYRASAAGAFRGDSAPTSWLHRIVVNACLDRMRRQKVRPTVPIPEREVGVPAAPDVTSRRELEIVVRDALRKLPPDQAAAIVLVDLEGWSVEEAARILGVAPGTVKSRCSRGRARLLPLLADLRNRATPGNQPAHPRVNAADPTGRTSP